MRSTGFSIRAKMLITFCLIIATVVAFSYLMFFVFRNRNNQLLYKAFSETLGLMTRSVETELEKFEDFSANLMTDPYVQDRINRMNGESDPVVWFSLGEELKNKLINSFTVPYVECIYAIDNRGRVVSVRNDYPKLETFVSPERLGDFSRSVLPWEWIETDSDTDTLYYLRRIRQVAGISLEQMGVLCFVIRKERFKQWVLDYPVDYQLEIGLFGRQELLYASNGIVKQIPRAAGSLTGSGFDILRAQGEEYFVVFIGSPSQPATYLCVVPYDSLFRDIEMFNTAFPLFCAGIFLLFLFVTVRFTRDISRPIVHLAEEMKNIESEDFTQAKLSLNGYTRKDEIGVLYNEFTLMLDKIENLINDNYRKQLLVKDAQYKTLQAQINPHFLYNTLESINWIAQLNNQDRIADMVQALGDLLRVSINAKKIFLTMQEEAELLRQYVLIQKIRYEERLEVTIDLEDSLNGYVIPKLTLQPFVENSIKYGLEACNGVCRINIRTEERDEHLVIHIGDNGPGMEEDLVRRILAGQVEARGSGIGIKNIRERLKQFYGDDFSLDIDSMQGRGTTVTITVAKLEPAEAMEG
jgi:two-component system sensor histidine kinase YesM